MKRIVVFALCASFLLCAFASCADPDPAGTGEASQPAGTGEPPQSGSSGQETDDSGEITPTASARYEYALLDLDLLRFAGSVKKGNTVISPVSVKYALGMLLAGTSGKGREELCAALGFAEEAGRENELESEVKSFNRFVEGFNAAAERSEGKNRQAVALADSAWRNSGVSEFSDLFKLRLEMFDADVFEFTPENIVKRANDWTKEKTRDLIPELFEPGYDASSLIALLVNALYLNVEWNAPWNPAGEKTFNGSSASTKKDFITTSGSFRYYKDEETELVAVPMQNSVCCLFVIGSTEKLADKLAQAQPASVRVTVPKLSVETSFTDNELVDFLCDRGATAVFNAGSGALGDMFAKDEGAFVSDIIHRAKLGLDENGIEAAAVTAVAVAKGGISQEPKIEFLADRDFGFFVYTSPSDWTPDEIVLFEGIVRE